MDENADRKKQLVGKLIRGETTPSNSFVSYLLDKVQPRLLELDQVIANKQKIMNMAAENNQKELQLRSTLDVYVTDIMHWQERGETDDFAIDEAKMGDGVG